MNVGERTGKREMGEEPHRGQLVSSTSSITRMFYCFTKQLFAFSVTFSVCTAVNPVLKCFPSKVCKCIKNSKFKLGVLATETEAPSQELMVIYRAALIKTL